MRTLESSVEFILLKTGSLEGGRVGMITLQKMAEDVMVKAMKDSLQKGR